VANLGGFPAGVVTVRVQLTTILGQHLSSKRRYRLCATAKHRRKNGAGNGVGRLVS
jgi:hypothetical protein